MTLHIPKAAILGLALVAIFLFASAGSCDGTSNANDQAIQSAQSNNVYIPKNHLEQDNYNQRQKLADDPATILWCTSAFTTTGAPIFTVPIVGKLTSGGKRPIATGYTPSPPGTTELPGPDGMYGSSGEYRYGFSPSKVYYDFYGIETFCTTEPTIFQKEKTTIVTGTDPDLFAAQQAAQKLLREACGPDATGPQAETAACKEAERQAEAILDAAIRKAGGK